MEIKGKIKLGSTCDISSAELLHEQLDSLSMNDEDIFVDASQVERIDTSVLQLLVSTSKTLAKKDHQLTISNPSEIFQVTSRLLDLSQYLYINFESPETGELR